MKAKFHPGDTVRVAGERGTSRIRSILTGTNGALLETQIGGYRSWNLDELRLVKRANPPRSRKVSEEVRTKLKEFWRKKKRDTSR